MSGLQWLVYSQSVKASQSLSLVSLSLRCSAFSKTRLLLELWRVLSCELQAVFLHFPLEEKGFWGLFYQLRQVLAKKETPTSNLTESTGDGRKFKTVNDMSKAGEGGKEIMSLNC